MENLPAVLDRVETLLAEARTSAELLNVMKLAQAGQHYAKLQGASHQIQADFLRLIVFSQMHVAAEYAVAQANGQVAIAEKGRPISAQTLGTSTPATLPQLGFDSRRMSEWRKKLAVGKLYIECCIQAALDAGNAPTDAEIRRAVSLELQEHRKSTLPMVSPAVGKYGTIVIDPPWPMTKIDRDVTPNQTGFDYPVMTVEEIEALSVAELADEACHLFLWTTQKFLPDALYCLDAWGFVYCLTMVWHKPGGFQPYGLPQYNCEFVVYGRTGGPKFTDTKNFPACFEAPRREHSRKPDEFYQTIARVTDGARLEMFARQARDGFEAWGNEARRFDG